MKKIEEKIENLFNKLYQNNPELLRIVLCQSRLVAEKALQITREKKLPLDEEDVLAAGLLHDIGVINCNAPSMGAKGKLPYICHGIEGKKILMENDFEKYASVCERHTGAGLTIQDIKMQNLPLPHIDMTPVTMLEKLICYADKFYSKSRNLEIEKTAEEVMSEMKKHGEDSLNRFLQLHSLFS